mgnify:CR=1 FL=1
MDTQAPRGAFDQNRGKIRSFMEEKGLKTIVLLGKGNVTYATGLREPSGALVMSGDCGDIILVPLLDYHRILASTSKDVDVKAFHRPGEESIRGGIPERDLIVGSLQDAILRVVESCSPDTKVVGVDINWAPSSIVKALEAKLQVVDVSSDIARVRSVKSDWEVELIESSLRIAEESLRRALGEAREGVTELELAGYIAYSMRRLGAWGEAFPTIVAFYDNTSYPHHTPTSTKLTVPGPLLMDLGAVLQGYHSDLTRTTWWGPSNPEFKQHLEAVIEAQEMAIDTVAPGVEAWEPDKSARVVLEKRGLSRYFTHGLGHGVGVEIHEEPFLRPASKTKLEKNMVVTVEPGIYIPGVYGIRVEDLVLVTAKGRRVLTRVSRILA